MFGIKPKLKIDKEYFYSGDWISKKSVGYDEIIAAINKHGCGGWVDAIENPVDFYYWEKSYYGLCGMRKVFVKIRVKKVVDVGIDLDENNKMVTVYKVLERCIPENYKRVE